MGKATPIYTNFTAGELSPLLDGRVDFEKYFNGCSTLLNFFPTAHGPARRRLGSLYICETKHQDRTCRLLPFSFSTTQNYVIELGHQYMRFIYDLGVGDGWEQIESGGSPVEIVIPYDEDELAQVKFIQSADVMYLFHPDYAPRVLTRTGHTAWTIAILTVENGPFLPENLTDTQVSVNAVSGNGITLLATAALFTDDHVGSLWKIRHDIEETIQTVTETFDGSVVKQTKTRDITAFGDTMNIEIPRGFRVGYVITGAFVATIELQFHIAHFTAAEPAESWITIEEFTSPVSFDSIRASDPFLYRYECTDYTSGTATVHLYRYADDEGSTSASVSIGPGEKLQYTLSGTFNGTFQLQRSWDGGAHWDTFATYSGSSTVDVEVENSFTESIEYRWRHWEYVSGTCMATLVHKKETGGEGWVEITARISDVQATANVVSENNLHSTALTSLWSEGAWSDVQGYPACGTFFENRLVFGGVPGAPQHFFASKTGGFDSASVDMETGPEATDAISFTTLGGQVDAALWIKTLDSLVAGTAGAEWVIGPHDPREPLTPDNVFAKQRDNEGSYDIDAIKAKNRILFVKRDGMGIKEISYSDERGGFNVVDRSILSEHIFDIGEAPSISDWCYQRNPYPVIRIIRADGVMVSMTNQPEHDAYGFSRYTTGQDPSLDDPSQHNFEACVSSVGSEGEELLFVVNRSTDAEDRRYIEFHNNYREDSSADGNVCLDSAIIYDGAAATVITGLDHLEGEQVGILADGIEVAKQTVNAGSVTLAIAAEKVFVGLPYYSDLRTMRIEAGRRGGTSQGAIKKIERVTFRLQNAWGGKAGPTFDDLDSMEWLDIGFALGIAPTLQTGDVHMTPFGQGTTEDGYICIRQDSPYPMTVVAIIAHVHTTDS